jgi:hypothetical protein
MQTLAPPLPITPKAQGHPTEWPKHWKNSALLDLFSNQEPTD